MTTTQCETCYRNGFPKPDTCPFPQFRNEEHCKKYRKGSAAPDGATPQSSEEPASSIPLTGTQDNLIAHKPAMPVDAKMRKRTYYVTPAQDRWLTNEAHRRTLSSGDKERVTEAQLVREALDRLMKGTQA